MVEQQASQTLLPTYALRAWLTALVGQMERASSDLEAQVEVHEKEIARLRAQMHRSTIAVTALHEAIKAVDNVLRRTRDAEGSSERRRTGAETEVTEVTEVIIEEVESPSQTAGESGRAQRRSERSR
jgi:septal ring factor EnvC (AmiA/AmiB activator)